MSRRRKPPRPDAPSISAEQAWLQFHDLLWLDIRGAPFCEHSITGALKVLHRDASHLLTHEPEKVTVLFCEDGVASRHAVAWLHGCGKRKIVWLEGGFRYWQICHPETLVAYGAIPSLTSDGTD